MRLLALALVALVACAGDPLPLTNCTAGVQTSCACPDGSSGAQRCAADGSGFGACMCEGRDAATADVVTADVVTADVVDVQIAPDVVAVDAPADAPRDVAVADVVRDAGADVVDVPPACDSSTPGNCCGVSCPRPAHTTAATCTAGACGFTCEAGWGDCDGMAANGCEVELATSVANCGACGAACRAAPTGEAPRCMGATCGVMCRIGFADCNGMIDDGCEVNTDTDRNNCGRCGGVCAVGDRCMGAGCFPH